METLPEQVEHKKKSDELKETYWFKVPFHADIHKELERDLRDVLRNWSKSKAKKDGDVFMQRKVRERTIALTARIVDNIEKNARKEYKDVLLDKPCSIGDKQLNLTFGFFINDTLADFGLNED